MEKARRLNSDGLRKPLMGLGRVELPTSRLSGVRSNHLSYRPHNDLRITYQNVCEVIWYTRLADGFSRVARFQSTSRLRTKVCALDNEHNSRPIPAFSRALSLGNSTPTPLPGSQPDS
jgi:hypothetical protein